eukprot:1845037-Rhodomonas_salina.1
MILRGAIYKLRYGPTRRQRRWLTLTLTLLQDPAPRPYHRDLIHVVLSCSMILYGPTGRQLRRLVTHACVTRAAPPTLLLSRSRPRP